MSFESSRPRCSLLRFCGSLLIVMAVSGPAFADTATMTRYFDSLARKAYGRHQYTKALEYFLLVARETPSPQAAYNVAVTADAAGDRELEYTYLQQYLDEPDGDASRQHDAERRMTALRTELALVTIQSEPPGASVFVDEKEHGSHGETPCTIVVEPGQRRISLVLENHHTASLLVDAMKGVTKTSRVALQPKTGQLVVKTTPPRAGWVALADGRQVASGTGGVEAVVPVGSYRIRIQPDGYRSDHGDVLIREGELAQIALTAQPLPPKLGRLLLSTGGIEGQLYVDGVRTASTPATLDSIEVGRHRLEVRAKGHETWRGEVSVREGETSFVEANLRRKGSR